MERHAGDMHPVTRAVIAGGSYWLLVVPQSSVLSKVLAAMVLVQTLRIFLNNTPQPEGWLGAMADARIGAALSRLHGDLAHRWTVESLATAAGMSRTAFAVRFKQRHALRTAHQALGFVGKED